MWRPRGCAPRKQPRGWSLPAARPDHSAIQAAKPALSEGAVGAPSPKGHGSPLSKGAVGASSPFVLRAPGPGLQGTSWDGKPFVMEKLSNLHPRESHLIHPASSIGPGSPLFRRWIHGRPPFRGWPAAPQPSSLPGSELLGDTGLSSSPIK